VFVQQEIALMAALQRVIGGCVAACLVHPHVVCHVNVCLVMSMSWTDAYTIYAGLLQI
jgi:hypothetical protein